MELSLIHCHLCPTSPMTYTTMGDLEEHLSEYHQRPLDIEASDVRLAFTAHVIGRPAPTTPPVQNAVAWSRAWMKKETGKEGA